jgi:peptidoglycan/xylan/chitin deacetylase (PgdA/CDA1 family)
MIKKMARGLLKFLPFKQMYAGVGHILMFHSVLPPQKGLRVVNNFLEVTPEHLEKVIQFFLKRRFQILSLDEMVEQLSAGNRHAKFVVFTFDDGYLDNLIYAYPIFKKYNIPFTIYITTNFPDYKATIWWYPLEEVLKSNPAIKFQFKGVEYNFECEQAHQKEAAFIKIRTLIQSCIETDKKELLDAIFHPYHMNLADRTKSLVLTWDQIKQLSEDPLVTIGAHTINHFRLGALSLEDAKTEIEESLKVIEYQLGKRVQHFSYPFGTKNDVGEREFQLAKEAGLKTAATTRPANIFPGHKDHLHALPRINIDMCCNEKELENIINGHSHFMTFKGKKVITD